MNFCEVCSNMKYMKTNDLKKLVYFLIMFLIFGCQTGPKKHQVGENYENFRSALFAIRSARNLFNHLKHS